MSLLRLLTAGKCFDGVGDSSAGRYRMRTPNLLPKFGSDKNPFAKKGKVATKESPATVTATNQNVLAIAKAPAVAPTKPAKTADTRSAAIKPLPVKRLAGPLPDTRPALAPEKAAKPKNPFAAPAARPASGVSVSGRVGTMLGWSKYLNPLTIWRGRESRAARVARPLPARSAVQGELSLDNVKVVRNDLSDADLEVISPRRAAVVVAEKMSVVPSLPVVAKGPSAWNRLTARFSRAEETTVP
jgi:hypothetical protein